jgi:RNA polymerase primary sigma factor
MDSLSTQERDILYSRFGLNDRVEMTLEEIAARYGVTRERIRQIQDKALRKLRHPARLRVLQEMSEGSLMQTGNGFSDLSKAS